jgi:hypothetical protein
LRIEHATVGIASSLNRGPKSLFRQVCKVGGTEAGCTGALDVLEAVIDEMGPGRDELMQGT